MAVRRSSIVKGAAVVAIAATIATVAIIAEGFDVAQTPVNDSAVWALQAGDGNRYARINTELKEIDTVKDAQNPSDLVQTASTALLLLERNGRIVDVDPSRPQDFTGDSVELGETPQGTSVVTATGEFVGYLTENGRVYAARIDDGADATAIGIDPYADENAQPGAVQKSYVADSIAIGANGVLYAYSSAEGAVLRFDLTTGDQLGFDDVANAPDDDGTAITAVGSTWALLSADRATLWIAGADPVDTDLTDDAVLQQPAASGSRVYVASRTGLVSFSLTDGDAATEVEQSGAIGIPAAPAELDGEIYAAWLSENTDSGLLWSSADGESELDYAGQQLGAEPVPVLRTNDSRMILNDTESGWVWTLPDGALVPSSQDWGIAAASNDDTTEELEQASVVTERKPPVAEDDQFGVRAGQLVSLPVMLNDHDPNEDVLTIDPASLSGLAGDFGTLSITNNSQDLAVQVAPGASGSTTFQYAVTDGTQSDGLVSELATVTLTVYGDDVNNPPVWCGVGECTRDWPVLQVQPGRSASVEVLRGWVDPEGDPIYLAGATSAGEIGSVATTPDGTVLFQHPDASLSGGSTEVTVRVADIRGAVAEKQLSVEVTATPSLTVEPFAITGTAGEPLTINPSKYITGVAGSYRVLSGKTETEDGTTTVVDNGATTFTFTAPTAGNYFVSYTVQDDLSEVISTVRVQVLAPDAQQLSAAPITVFVRPKADATIDVFPSVTNPSKKVLLLTEALPTPLGGASLDVAVVNQQLLRVKGSTADGQAGVLGTVKYTVSDGTGNALQTAHGEATVILLPQAAAQAPIAVPDAVTVRAGSQIDVPVLDNDLAPDGNALILNPDKLVYESEEGLAFVSGSKLRLLAPETPGDYEATYTVYSAGAPDVSAAAIVRITVLPAGENRAPEPHTLVGRVLAGSTVSIPFDSFGVDPDGDTVVLDRILSQPESGSATIAPTGDAIVYTSVPGFAGPVEFEYRVTDQFGETGSAFVRVGVIDQESDPSPVTYSDYVEVQLGKTNTVTVQPAANDIDPAGKKLEVTDVVPDAPAGTAEYDELAALIGLTEDGIVTLTAGEVLGTRSFYYTVTNTTGDSAIGLIVMKVVRESVPDHPRVSDTYLTIEDRSAFSSGIDVVTGKVSWNSGDISDLELTLWGDDSGYSSKGWKISGSLPDDSVVIPFKLTGTNVLGTEVSTFGFLRIPGKNDIILALKSGTPPQEVNESESVSFDLADLVSVPSGESLQLDDENVETAGKRAAATCTVDSGTKLTYTAGAGDPWVDYCAVPAKLSGQDDYTVLIVAIDVIPEIPLPILRSAAITHSPAAAPTTYNLLNMVEWAGKQDDASLEFAISYTGDQFSVVQNGTELTVYALDAANPGRENTVRVSLSSHPEVASAALSLKVGPAPTELPKGGTVAKECSQAGNTTNCLIKVIGVPGEVNIYRTPLTLVSVSVPASCTGVSMEVADASTVRASWTGDAPGGKCTGTFVVKDPQGKVSSDDRNGSVLLDLQGFPKAPSSLTQSGYDDGLIKLSVNPGAATAAYPALTGFTIYRGTTVVSHCSAVGVCDDITGVANGSKQTYKAVAVNAVGDSKTGVESLAWAYKPPVVDDVTREVIYKSSTSDTEGWVRVTIESSDSTARGFLVTGSPSEVNRTGGTTTVEVKLAIGTRTITVTPVSQYQVPDGVGPTAGNTNGFVDVVGKPAITGTGVLGPVDETHLQLTGATFDDRFAGDDALDVHYIAYRAVGGSANCSVDSNGDLNVSVSNGVDAGSNGASIGPLTTNKVYNVKICVSNGFGIAQADAGSLRPYTKPETPTGYTYTINASGSGGFLINPVAGDAPSSSDYAVKYSDYSATFGSGTSVSVQFCLVEDMSLCGDPAAVTPAVATRQYQILAQGFVQPTCVRGGSPLPGINEGSGLGSVASYSYTYRYQTGTVLGFPTYDEVEVTDGSPVPVEAINITDYSVSFVWQSGGGANEYTYDWNPSVNITCTG
jgi:hypothetical protein